MRPTSPDRGRGFTLVEGIVVLVITAILAVMATFFVAPLQQSLDVVTRADLTDTADTALQRIGREAQLALPNSVRVTSDIPGNRYLEFLAVRTAGRYRGDTGGANANVCPADGSGLGTPGSDQLSFDVSDGCFKTVGKIPNPAVGARDYLVLNNMGDGFAGQDAYAAGAANRAKMIAIDSATETGRDKITFNATTFNGALHNSPGQRFFITSGPVSYGWDRTAQTITRYWDYTTGPNFEPLATQPTTFASGSSGLIASNVEDAVFDYTQNVAPQVGLLTLRITLSRTRASGGTERITLYHAVHVNNVP